MTLKEKIQSDKILALKDASRSLNTLLGTVLGEMDRVSKDPTDEESTKIIRKMIESSRLCHNEVDAQILESYLPKLISTDELEKIIKEFCSKENVSSKKDIGKVMNFLKQNYNGLYDGKIAGGIINKFLN